MTFEGSLYDPVGLNALVHAVQWLEGTLLGTIATTIAVVAVASVGVGMLTGNLTVRRGATVVAGCFIIFGASSIVAGLQRAVSGAPGGDGMVMADPVPPIVVPPRTAPVDPYAGASLRRW